MHKANSSTSHPVQWEVIYHAAMIPLGTVLVHPNRNGQYCAYRALPVCPGLNWKDTYPDTESKLSKDRNELIRWLKDA